MAEARPALKAVCENQLATTETDNWRLSTVAVFKECTQFWYADHAITVLLQCFLSYWIMTQYAKYIVWSETILS